MLIKIIYNKDLNQLVVLDVINQQPIEVNELVDDENVLSFELPIITDDFYFPQPSTPDIE